jgi:hypothetical protein
MVDTLIPAPRPAAELAPARRRTRGVLLLAGVAVAAVAVVAGLLVDQVVIPHYQVDENVSAMQAAAAQAGIDLYDAPHCGATTSPRLSPAANFYVRAVTVENQAEQGVSNQLGAGVSVSPAIIHEQIALDSQFANQIASYPFTGRPARDAAALVAAIRSYDSALLPALSAGGFTPALAAQASTDLGVRGNASTALRLDLRLPVSSCIFHRPGQ